MKNLQLYALIIITCIAGASAAVQVNFTTPGLQNWTAPPGTMAVIAEVWGGGGAGGGASTNQNGGSGGGGGGAYSRSTINVIEGTTYSLFVADGVLGTTGNASDANSSWFISNTTILARGGTSGKTKPTCFNGIGGNASQGIGDVKFSGGNSTFNCGVGDPSGGGGGGAGNESNGGNTPFPPVAGGNGSGGNFSGGSGGIGRSTDNSGGNASTIGGGGGGAFCDAACTAKAGGNGARGEIRLTYIQGMTITAQDDFTNTTINTFNATIQYYTINYTYSTTNGTIQTNITTNSTNKANITIRSPGYQEKTYSNQDTTNLAARIYVGNSYITYRGSISGLPYTPVCTTNGTLLTQVGTNYYELPLGNNTVLCDSSDYYENKSFTIYWNGTAVTNTSVLLTEYAITLSYTGNVSGIIVWRDPYTEGGSMTGGEGNLNSTNGYNTSSFQYIRISSNFTDGATIVIRTNNQSCSASANDSCAQYYEFINDVGVVTRDTIYKLSKIDYVVSMSAQTLSNDRLDGTTIRVMTCDNRTTSGQACKVVQQILTPNYPNGANIYLDKDLFYIVTVSKTGYETAIIGPTRGIDLTNEDLYAISLQPLITTYNDPYRITGPLVHYNNSILYYTISGITNTNYYWNTSYKNTLTQESIINGGSNIELRLGTDYALNQNVTLYIYSLDSSLNPTLETSFTTTWNNGIPVRDFDNNYSDGNNLVGIILFIVLIAASSIIGYRLTTSTGVDAGYYTFAAGSIFISSFYSTMLPVAITCAILVAGNLALNAMSE